MVGKSKTAPKINELKMVSLAGPSPSRFLESNHFIESTTFAHATSGGKYLGSRSTQGHCRDILATSVGTARRGIKRCAKTLSLFTKPGMTSPPPFANDSKAARTTSSGD